MGFIRNKKVLSVGYNYVQTPNKKMYDVEESGTLLALINYTGLDPSVKVSELAGVQHAAQKGIAALLGKVLQGSDVCEIVVKSINRWEDQEIKATVPNLP